MYTLTLAVSGSCLACMTVIFTCMLDQNQTFAAGICSTQQPGLCHLLQQQAVVPSMSIVSWLCSAVIAMTLT